MHIDSYTKTVLTVIALALAAIAIKPLFQPAGVSAQGGPLAGVQLMAGSSSFDAFNTATGDVWLYAYENGRYDAKYIGRIEQLGQPMVNTLRQPPQ